MDTELERRVEVRYNLECCIIQNMFNKPVVNLSFILPSINSWVHHSKTSNSTFLCHCIRAVLSALERKKNIMFLFKFISKFFYSRHRVLAELAPSNLISVRSQSI